MSAASPTPAERALAAMVYAPIGLGAAVVDELPGAIAKARQQLVFARFIGKMAVDRGVRDLRGRLDELAHPSSTADTSAASSSSETSPSETEAAVDASGATVQTDADAEDAIDEIAATDDDAADDDAADDDAADDDAAEEMPTQLVGPEALALPDYDQLPAAHIVGKLDGLTAAELDAVEAHETAHRHRRTVLGKISQLRGG